jgi:uncharacterized RDD family membrane protein YckC
VALGERKPVTVHGVEYADRVAIATPEGVELEVELGGLGSRFLAQMIDWLLTLVLIGALAILLFAIGSGVATAVYLVLVFLIWFGYDVLFEVLANGRTPGKRLCGLRVVRSGGQPIGFLASSVRNLMRLVDGPLTLYLGGILSIVMSERNQRLGDMAADTLVVREPPAPEDAPVWGRGGTTVPPPPAAATNGDQWDVSAISQEELAAVRQFLERRWTIDAEARRRLAWQLAEGLRPKVAGAPPDLEGEKLLERLAAAKASRL